MFTSKLDRLNHFFIISLIGTQFTEDTLHFYRSLSIGKYIDAHKNLYWYFNINLNKCFPKRIQVIYVNN